MITRRRPAIAVNVADWLRRPGLEQYAPVFAAKYRREWPISRV
jgi:hypothetical protein